MKKIKDLEATIENLHEEIEKINDKYKQELILMELEQHRSYKYMLKKALIRQ